MSEDKRALPKKWLHKDQDILVLCKEHLNINEQATKQEIAESVKEKLKDQMKDLSDKTWLRYVNDVLKHYNVEVKRKKKNFTFDYRRMQEYYDSLPIKASEEFAIFSLNLGSEIIGEEGAEFISTILLQATKPDFFLFQEVNSAKLREQISANLPDYEFLGHKQKKHGRNKMLEYVKNSTRMMFDSVESEMKDDNQVARYHVHMFKRDGVTLTLANIHVRKKGQKKAFSMTLKNILRDNTILAGDFNLNLSEISEQMGKAGVEVLDISEDYPFTTPKGNKIDFIIQVRGNIASVAEVKTFIVAQEKGIVDPREVIDVAKRKTAAETRKADHFLITGQVPKPSAVVV